MSVFEPTKVLRLFLTSPFTIGEGGDCVWISTHLTYEYYARMFFL